MNKLSILRNIKKYLLIALGIVIFPIGLIEVGWYLRGYFERKKGVHVGNTITKPTKDIEQLEI